MKQKNQIGTYDDKTSKINLTKKDKKTITINELEFEYDEVFTEKIDDYEEVKIYTNVEIIESKIKKYIKGEK